MATMGKYCKAYHIGRFRDFSGWIANIQNARKEIQEVDGTQIEITREFSEQDHFYLHENFVVTDGIFLDENIIFDHVSPEWIGFCKSELKFEAPVYDLTPSNVDI